MAPPPVSLPMGARFQPRDEEKINYLYNKVKGKDLPCDDFIGTDDLYGDKEPWEIFGDSKERELYFFTVLKKIGKKSTAKRFSRNVGGGTWTNKGQKVPVYGSKGRCVGYKRSFRYERRKKGDDNEDDKNGTWLLKEYTLPDDVVESLEQKYKDNVLCELKRKGCGRKILGHAGSGSGSDAGSDGESEGGLENRNQTAEPGLDNGVQSAAVDENRVYFDLNF